MTLMLSANPKHLAKDIRATMKISAPPKNPYAALMQPMVIVPNDPAEKVVIADAGTIVKLADQTNFYRDRVSPITRRSDEILVHYGSAKKPSLGWLTNMLGGKVMKSSKGPTFLARTSSEDALNAWEQFRLKVARTRSKDPTNWIAPWLAHHGSKYPSHLREVTRLFGGKPIKNESSDTRIERLFTLILHTELDMATAKSKKSKKHKVRDEKPKGKTAKPAKQTKSRVGGDDRLTSKHDGCVIKRLVQENPRRAGSAKAKLWDKLRKGMTVGEFVGKGASRASIKRMRENGWIKLLKPKGDAE